MNNDVMINERLMQAYKNALYVARLPHATIELRVGEPCPLLADWLVAQGVKTAAFLTAFNPRSEVLSLQENESRHAQLLAAIAQLGLPACDGYGTDEGGDWPREISALVTGITLAQAMLLAEKFAQNAFLFFVANGVVELHCCKGLAH